MSGKVMAWHIGKIIPFRQYLTSSILKAFFKKIHAFISQIWKEKSQYNTAYLLSFIEYFVIRLKHLSIAK
jgi:hypothetical protein